MKEKSYEALVVFSPFYFHLIQVSSSSCVLKSLILSVDHQISFSYIIRSNIYVVRSKVEAQRVFFIDFALILNKHTMNLLKFSFFLEFNFD